MAELKYCTKEELNHYEKTSDWNVNIYNEFSIEKTPVLYLRKLEEKPNSIKA